MSRKRWKYCKSKHESDDLALATLLVSDFLERRTLTCNQDKAQQQLPLELPSASLSVQFSALSGCFDPVVWKVIKIYFDCHTKLSRKEAAVMCGLSTYKFGKEVQRFNTLIEAIIKTL